MVSPKNISLALIGFLIAALGIFPTPLFASQSKYYDFGPYYQTPGVLGFSLSIQENLPPLEIPASLVPPPASGILPDSPFYPFERFIENTQLTFTFDPVSKANLRVDLAAERLSEAKTLMDAGKNQAAITAFQSYTETLTDLTKNLSQISAQQAQESSQVLNNIDKAVAAQAIVTTSLSLISSPAQAESLNQAADSSREVLDEIAQLNGKPAIPEELSKGIQSLKEQGLISEEESNKLYSFKDRSEVREELTKLAASGGIPPTELAKLDESIAQRYPEVYKQQVANLEVVELRSYQALSQPPAEVVEQLADWQKDPSIPPSNDIKPYLWYNRAQNLAKEVNLSNFSGEQQTGLVKLYPDSLLDNPTYSPPPSPRLTPIPSPTPDTTTETDSDQTSPSPSPSQSPEPTPTPVPADPYLQQTGGTLPGQPTYILKQLGETLSYTFTFDPTQKARLRMQQAERRLAEATALSADPKKASLYEAALKNYQQVINNASNQLKNLKDEEDAKDVAKQLEAQAARHSIVFEKGFLPAPAKNPELITSAIHATEDAMDRSADKLERLALPPVLASRLGDLKAQGLILDEEAEDLVGSSSREEVREKIRKLLELKTFPLADAKKLDEAQTFTSPSDYNQLVEVRKVEELQNLRSTQADLAQTQTLRASLKALNQQEAALNASIDPSVIKPEDLEGRDDLLKTYQKLSSAPRPINRGQFGPEATPGAEIAPPKPADAVLTACPEGAVFKQFEGCVWADSGRSLNDYEQYKCDGPRQYYSFAVRECVAYDETKGWNKDDAQPICPVGYTWSWQTQSCQVSTGGILPFPSPSPEPEPIDDQEREERSKKCPEGSSYQAPNGCVWDDSGKSVYDPDQYRCGRGRYYSFEEHKCVYSPKEGEPYPKDNSPSCKEEGAYWSWTEGKCVQAVIAQAQTSAPTINFDLKPTFAAPDNPFYFLKQAAEQAQQAIAFTPQAREQAALSRAKERLAEAMYALKKDNEEAAKKALVSYTSTMQNLVSDLSEAKLADGAKEEIANSLSERASEQNLLLQKISAIAPASQDTALSAALSATILGVDKAADIAGEPPIPDEVKTKIESLPAEMISEEDKKKLLEADSRVEARLNLGGLLTNGALTQTDTAFLNEDFDKADPAATIKADELKKLEQMARTVGTKEKALEKIEENEKIVQNLQEFEKDFEPGKEIPAEVRPYVRLTRIDEIAQTIRPDIVNLNDFQNRKDVILAVATLQEEFKPTKEAMKQVEDFRRRNPNAPLPPELARVEALSYSLGVRGQAGPCFLPTPPFPANTPCPPPGAAIPISSYYTPGSTATAYTPTSFDKDGKPLVYGQGPKAQNPGVCPSGYHWMYDSGGWCMSDSGSYNSSYNYTPIGTGSGYTPYSPYYTAPGAPPTTYGYPTGGSYPTSPYSYYGAPSYYGPAPTGYTTYPPSGTVPGSGPAPISPGKCPTGFHWMSDNGGWCMADGPTYVPGGGTPYSSYPSGTTTNETPPAGGYNCGSQPYDPVTKRCKDGACPSGFNWNGSQCVASSYSNGPIFSGSSYTSCPSGYSWTNSGCQPSSSTYSSGGSNYYSPSSYQYGCTPGYYWDGSKCQKGSYEGTGWSDTAARSGTYCQPPSGGCGSGWFDYGSCSCKQASTQGCYNVSASSCPSGWYFDSAACTCRQSTSSGTSGGSTGTSSGSCQSGYHWMSENGGYCMPDSAPSGSSGGSTSSGGGSSGISCPSGYHPMDNSWCMADSERDGNGGGSTSTNTSSTPAPSAESTPPPSTSTTTESAPPPPSEPAPAEPAPSP